VLEGLTRAALGQPQALGLGALPLLAPLPSMNLDQETECFRTDVRARS